MADIPHFDLPFSFSGPESHVAEVEQDSVDDLAVCVEAICRTRPEQRLEIEDFGIDDPTFQVGGLDPNFLLGEIIMQEPRVAVAVEEDWDFAAFTQELMVNITQGVPDDS